MGDNVKKLILLLAIVLSLLFVLGLYIVSRLLEVPDQVLTEPVEHIKKISGLEFPADAKLLYREKADRGISNKFIWRIIYTKTPFNIKNYNTRRIATKSGYESIRSSLKNSDVGLLPVEFFLTYEWTNEDGEWSGDWVETTNGYYLRLQQITRLKVPKQILSEPVEYIESMSGLEFPADAKLLYRVEADRGASNSFISRIIYTKSPFNIKSDKMFRESSESDYEDIRSSLNNMDIDIGLPVELSPLYVWSNKEGKWNGILVETSNGYYLDLQQVITNDDLLNNKIGAE